ncbi:hypothetical protein CMUS01_12219 [Colletotrichum musicola]|uniref:Uncharacterized protein n=1 Tax=Colletotrichum musicola TaxID=2175873 RepID=A0A8H6N1D0_9PEZI|nr:hypothetical protein CMUS01_12219 [Colletotrichum musicola]
MVAVYSSLTVINDIFHAFNRVDNSEPGDDITTSFNCFGVLASSTMTTETGDIPFTDRAKAYYSENTTTQRFFAPFCQLRLMTTWELVPSAAATRVTKSFIYGANEIEFIRSDSPTLKQGIEGGNRTHSAERATGATSDRHDVTGAPGRRVLIRLRPLKSGQESDAMTFDCNARGGGIIRPRS